MTHKELVEAAKRISPTLPALTPKQRLAALHAEGSLRATKDGVVWCTSCGAEFRVEGLKPGDVAVCPHCGRREKPSFFQRKKYSETQKAYCSLTDVREGLQVIRNFFIKKDLVRKRSFFDVTYQESSLSFELYEVSQIYLTPDGKDCAVMARSCFSNIWYYDIWKQDSEMAYKRAPRDAYFITGYRLPGCKTIPELKRAGLKRIDDNFNLYTHFRLLLTNPFAESLQKHGQKALLRSYCEPYARQNIDHFQPSIRVAMRHGLKVRDAGIYLDYLKDCERLGYDLHNPKYICIAPGKPLREAHQETQRRIAILEAKAAAEEAERKKMRNAQAIAEYEARMQAYAGLCLTSGSLTILPIMTVADVQEEGKEMHHCVFSCEYYKRKDSLLLTARVGEKREETVEFSLRSGAVLQSRAVCNKTTPLHSNIIQLVEDNAARLIALSKTAETAR